MKKFNLFNRSRKEKDLNKYDGVSTNDLNNSEPLETIETAEDLDFYRNKKKNHETAEDAVSIRSVDGNNKIKWFARGMKKNSNTSISKSFSTRDQTSSFRNLNIIKEMGESPAKLNNNFSKSMIICSPNKDGSFYSGLIKNENFNIDNLSQPITTGGIARRHDSTSSTHSSMRKPWIETDGGRIAQTLLSKDEIERQNIIYELLMGEKDSLNDLKRVITNYRQPLVTLKLVSQNECFNIFYKIDHIIPLYENLIYLLEKEKDDLTVINYVGKSLLKWSETLDPIINYCTHLYYSKSLLEEKRKEKEFAEFLNCCSGSKFSRKLDLWVFLDNPRSRLMKYPLLIERILKSTPESHMDASNLVMSLKNFERVLAELDNKTGEEMCKFYLEKLEFLEQNQHIQLVKRQNVLLLEGHLKIVRSLNCQKIHAFLFNDVLIFTKAIGEDNIEKTKYVVYGSPLPTNRLVVENIEDGEIKMGSFRSTFSSDNGSKNVFRLTLLSDFIPECELENQREYHRVYDSLSNVTDKMSHSDTHENASRDCRLLKNSQTILQVSKYEEKQLWLSSLRKVVAKEIMSEELF